MARGNRPKVRQKWRWVAQPYMDHANQPAVFMVHKVINAEEIREAGEDFPANPKFAVQVYSTVLLDSDHTALCEYLYREISSWPSMSFEIYSHQPDTTIPGEGFFPGIAKAVLNLLNQLPQGFLLVITSHSYREDFHAPDYEDETGPLWVNFNRSFPLKAIADERSRLQWVPLTGYNPSAVEESDICPEREEIIVRKCRHLYHPLHKLNSVLRLSYINDDDFDYGLDDDEGDLDSLIQLPAPEMIESWQLKANSNPYDEFSVQASAEGSILIISKAADVEPDLQCVIYVSFAHTSTQLLSMARAFSAAIIENLPHEKTNQL